MRITDHLDFPAGSHVFGDPCHCARERIWEEMQDHPLLDGAGKRIGFLLERGRNFAAAFDIACGILAGWTERNEEREFVVDSGLIGIVSRGWARPRAEIGCGFVSIKGPLRLADRG